MPTLELATLRETVTQMLDTTCPACGFAYGDHDAIRLDAVSVLPDRTADVTIGLVCPQRGRRS